MLNIFGAALPRQGGPAQNGAIASIGESIPRNGTSSAPKSTTQPRGASRAPLRQIEDGNWFWIQKGAWDRLEGPQYKAARDVYSWLAYYDGPEHRIIPSVKTLATKTGRSRRAVQYALRQLEELVVIVRVERYDEESQDQTSNGYFLTAQPAATKAPPGKHTRTRRVQPRLPPSAPHDLPGAPECIPPVQPAASPPCNGVHPILDVVIKRELNNLSPPPLVSLGSPPPGENERVSSYRSSETKPPEGVVTKGAEDGIGLPSCGHEKYWLATMDDCADCVLFAANQRLVARGARHGYSVLNGTNGGPTNGA